MSTHKFGFIMLVDRFTGGVRKGALFSEEVTLSTEVYRAYLAGRVTQKANRKNCYFKALDATIDDMKKRPCYRWVQLVAEVIA